MQKVTFLIGFPGSGKTTYLSTLNQEQNLLVCDNFHKDSKNYTRNIQDSQYFSELKASLLEGKDVVISDIIYCIPEELSRVKKVLKQLLVELDVKTEIEEVYFENAPEACIANILRRARPERTEWEVQFVKENTSTYHIPTGSKVLSVYRP